MHREMIDVFRRVGRPSEEKESLTLLFIRKNSLEIVDCCSTDLGSALAKMLDYCKLTLRSKLKANDYPLMLKKLKNVSMFDVLLILKIYLQSHESTSDWKEEKYSKNVDKKKKKKLIQSNQRERSIHLVMKTFVDRWTVTREMINVLSTVVIGLSLKNRWTRIFTT